MRVQTPNARFDISWEQTCFVEIPAGALVAMVGLGLGAGYYFAAAQGPIVVTWVNPIHIKFTMSSGTYGSASDSFTCSSTRSPVMLQAQSSAPSTVTLTVTPSAFSGCGSSPDNVVVTASCTPSALTSGTRTGDYSGLVTVCGPTPNTCLKRHWSSPSRSRTNNRVTTTALSYPFLVSSIRNRSIDLNSIRE